MMKGILCFVLLMALYGCGADSNIHTEIKEEERRATLKLPIHLDFFIECDNHMRASSEILASYKGLFDSFYVMDLTLSGLNIYCSQFSVQQVWEEKYKENIISLDLKTTKPLKKYPIALCEMTEEEEKEWNNRETEDLDYQWWYDSRYLSLTNLPSDIEKSTYEGLVIDLDPITDVVKYVTVHGHSNDDPSSIILGYEGNIVARSDFRGNRRIQLEVPHDEKVDKIYLLGNEVTLRSISIE